MYHDLYKREMVENERNDRWLYQKKQTRSYGNNFCFSPNEQAEISVEMAMGERRVFGENLQ